LTRRIHNSSILIKFTDMKRTVIALIILAFATNVSHAQDRDSKYLDKVKSLDSTIKNLYAVISGEKGGARNWEFFKYLFHPEAKLIPTWKTPAGKVGAKYLSTDEYIESSGKWLIENGFFEKEIYRTSNSFGPVSQVFSTYESFNSEKDEKPFMRGINSIQLLYDGTRWWIVNIYWTQESADNPIPVNYLPK